MKSALFPNKWLVATAFTASFLYNQVAVSYEEENMAIDDSAPVVDDMPVEDVGTPEDILADGPSAVAAPAAKSKPKLPKETVSQKKARAAKKAASPEVKKEVAAAPEVASTTTPVAETTSTATTTAEVAANETAPVTTDKMISDGSVLTIEKLGISIAPPAGWEVLENAMGMSLVLREPAPAQEAEMKPGEEKIIFQRNITVVAMHETSPIDENEAAKMKEKLNEQFGKQTGIESFQVLEHKFFDYKGKNDGMIIYTAFVMNSIPMTQMHVMVSGQDNRFLMTYTDLASEFEANQDAYGKAWATMSTVQVVGNAPVRYENAKLYGAIAAGVAFLIGFLVFMRRRLATKKYQSEDVHAVPSINGDEHSSVSSLWSLDGGAMTDAPISAVSNISEVGTFNFGDNKEDFNQGIDFSDVEPLSTVSRIR